VVAASLSTLSESGFINYFGLQRFGTSATPTHVVGRSLLKKEFARSVELVLSSRLGSHVPPFPLQQRDVDSLFPKIAK
jgi:tRNA pseudouridine13 synthase